MSRRLGADGKEISDRADRVKGCSLEQAATGDENVGLVERMEYMVYGSVKDG